MEMEIAYQFSAEEKNQRRILILFEALYMTTIMKIHPYVHTTPLSDNNSMS